MIPFLVFWRRYTTTIQGSALKDVRCENCSTEYVYVINREGAGAGVSMYMLNNEGASENSTSGASESLNSALKNDYDPVPCPVCGHYQRYMFPKLTDGKWQGLQALMLLVILGGCFAAAIALYCSAAYLLDPNDYDFKNMVTAWSAVLGIAVIGVGLSLVRRSKIRRFDPNLEDQEERLAIGRSRAVTRAEYERTRQKRQTGSKWGKESNTDLN